MKYFLIALLFSGFICSQFSVNGQNGNYAVRDSTSNLPSVSNNTVIGTKAAPDLNNVPFVGASGDNTIFGSYAGFKLGTNIGNNSVAGSTLIGSKAGYNCRVDTSSLSGATFVGAFSGFNTGKLYARGGGTFVGYKAGYNGGNPESVAIGVEAGFKGVGENSTYVGNKAGYSAGTYDKNVFIGSLAGYRYEGNLSVLIGYYSGGGDDTTKTSGYANTFVGAYTGLRNTSVSNTFIGTYAGRNNVSQRNTFVGSGSGQNTTSGLDNSFLGQLSGAQLVVGGGNTFLGQTSGRYIRSGGSNVCIGKWSGGTTVSDSLLGSITTIGYQATVSGSGSTAIGAGSKVTISNALVLGAINVNVGIGNTAPQNKLEITSATTNTSGLRFTNLKSTSTPSTANSLGLSVDANGDVILVSAGGGGSVTPDSMLVKYIGATKFVGMGVASPIEKLHVSGGNLRVDNVLPRIYMKNTTTNTDITLAQLGTDNIIKLANSAIFLEAGGGIPSMFVKNNAGNIGIGNTNPTNKLEITTTTANTSGLRFTNLKSTSTPSAANSLALSVDANGDVILVSSGGGGTLPQGADVWDQLTNGADYLIRNKNNKSVMIGVVAATKTNADYKLYVEKGILAEKVKVSANANWPDYVFGKDYSLMPLKEVENYITTNNHLPEVPSAEVIAKDGLDLGKMDATLLKKVEELTLYLIEQSKEIQMLKKKIIILEGR